MFGLRSDGKAVGSRVDAFTRITPYIMPDRNDAQNFNTVYVDVATITDYVREKRAEGRPMSTMAVILAGYVRMIATMPELNRFVVNRKLYARKYLSVSFVVINKAGVDNFEETNVKIKFRPTDTIFEVAEKVEAAIAENQKSTADNATTQLANKLVGIPGLLSLGVPFLKWLDKVGLLPKAVIEASPFHTSCFITNMASVRVGKLYHHLYNFGTTSQFLGLGEKERQVYADLDGNVKVRYVYPIGVVTDERVAAGSFYALGFRTFKRCMANPRLMETPPETVRWDCDVQY